jgi:tetratricopeptide (TPR) repeat protein
MSAPGATASPEKPTDRALLLKRAVDFVRAGRLAEAEAACREMLESHPRDFDALHLMGIIDLRRGRHAEALQQFDLALSIDDTAPDAHNNRGNALNDLKRYEEALVSYDRAIALRPEFGEAFFNRGNALVGLERFEEALDCYDKGIAVRPYATGFVRRGMALWRLNRFEEAVASLDRAIALEPGNAEAFNARANVLLALGRVDEALASYDRSIALAPARAEGFYDRAHGRLLVGDYAGGWADNEWRWQSKGFVASRPVVDAPPWQGQDLTGRRILVFREQGLGDIIQFARYLPLLRQTGANVTFLVGAPLVRLLRPVTAGVEVVSQHKRGDAFDFQCALMSLPHRFKTDLSSIPPAPYLSAEPELAARWKERIGGHGFKIGIAWQGNPKAMEKTRFVPLEHFVPLARIPGVRLISLQYKDGLDQLAGLPADALVETLGEDFNSGPDAFVDTAAVTANLDLIVSCDTSIPHVAGALGRPTWIALKQVPDWRWMLDREDSPWYPSVRLFRQPQRDDWRSVFARIEQELRSVLALPAASRALALRTRTRPAPAIRVSWGELFDRIAMLEIELEALRSPAAVTAVRRELAALSASAAAIEAECPGIVALKGDLRAAHAALRDAEAALRAKEAAQSFDGEFIALTQSVRRRNEERARVKHAIDRLVDPASADERLC